ncbi:zinc finger protein 239 isoform X1 [Gadus morhua]|uniref:zinc finger protein 239 isoform X1 n=1 Tax=Gadus morhua TaxID=8049 RepID=UPI0011B70A5D|nr:zinc finger protein 239-like isoform X1 [Gadus morhua]
MSRNMSPCGSTLQEQLSSIMEVLSKAAVSEISQLFSDGSATLQLQITQSSKENQVLRMRMKVMRSELFSLRLQTRSNASRAASRFPLNRANLCKPRTKSMGNCLKPLIDHKAVGHSPFYSPSKSEASSVISPAEQETPDIISIKIEEDISRCRPDEDCDAFGDRSTTSAATSESLPVDIPGSSHVSSQNAELRILSVFGQGGGKLVVEGHDTLFTASEVEALNSLSADCSVAQSLDCSERLDCRKELAVQETADTILIKEEEDIGGCIPPLEDCNDMRECSTHRSATSDSLPPDDPGSSHMSRHNGELRILSVHGHGVGQLMVDRHDTLFSASEVEALSSLSVDHSVAKIPDCGERLVHCEELTGHRGGRKGRPCVLCGKVFPNDSKMTIHMRTHSSEKRHRCDQCMKRFRRSYDLKIHMMIHSGEMPYKCDQCMKGFRRSCDLKIHMWIHSGERPYNCDRCMKGFRRSYDLKIHMRIHFREKPYKCDQCIKGFRRSCDLKNHMRTHSGETP